MQEYWGDIEEFDGLYQASNLGRIRNKKTERILKCQKNKKGYLVVGLRKNNTQITRQVHRLVAKTFIPNPENKPQVNHKDGNKEDCCISNLEWNTNGENGKHAYDTGLRKKRIGKEHFKAKTVEQYDLEGNLVKIWNSIADIERQLNIKHTNICMCCKGNRKTTGGYTWRYRD